MSTSETSPAAEYNWLVADVRRRAFEITGDEDNPFAGLTEDQLENFLEEILWFLESLTTEHLHNAIDYGNDEDVEVTSPVVEKKQLPKIMQRVADAWDRSRVRRHLQLRWTATMMMIGMVLLPTVVNQTVPVMEMQLDDVVQDPIGAMEELLPSPKDYQRKLDLLEEIMKPLPEEDGVDDTIDELLSILGDIRRELFELREKEREEDEEEKQAAS